MTAQSTMNPTPPPMNPIDEMMENASQLLSTGQYLQAAMLCREALLFARSENDFRRMSRICMPMLEAQRALRQIALDEPQILIIASSDDIPTEPHAGCYLFTPNFVGADTRRFRTAANDAGIGVFCLTKEPKTSKGRWPIVGVGERVVRVQVDPPSDDIPNSEWFSKASESLGDQAIQDAKNASESDDPKQWIVDDFLDVLDACPEHEKLIMALAGACQHAADAPATQRVRRRGIINDPYSF